MPHGEALRRLVGRFHPVRLRVFGIFLLVLLRSALEIAGPFLTAAVIGTLVVDEAVPDVLPDDYVVLVWVLAGVYVLKNIVFYISQVAAARLAMDLENGLRHSLRVRDSPWRLHLYIK